MSRTVTTQTSPAASLPMPDSRFTHIQPKGSWEIPRKVLHYSIGFGVLYLYTHGFQASDIYPSLIMFLSIVLSAEVLRFSFDWFNVIYCWVMGPLMRRTEITGRVNGVAYYLGGCIVALYCFPTDIAALSIIYLSWTDPTASICGRLWGRYTPRFGNKSLAGTLGAMVTGALVTALFFGYWPYATSYDPKTSSMSLLTLAVYGGVVAGVSEGLSDSFGVDDNMVIPIASSLLLWIALVGAGWGTA